ncbi:MAG TPA: hypothetical protein VE261_02905 [Gaiellaceae bacterium]|nr:hypothetical protein [Gaiellaceae bacterium]
MVRWRTRNSEQKLQKIEEEEAAREADEGILELFHRDEEERDEDAPLARDNVDE